MKTTVKIFSISEIVLGGLALLDSLSDYGDDATYAFIGGAFILAAGIVTLVYVNKQK